MSQPRFKIEGGIFKKLDSRTGEWLRCGLLENDNGHVYYVTHKREVLRLHNSLGVSEDILQFLLGLVPQPVIKFLLGERKPYSVYVIPSRVLLTQGVPVICGNEKEITRHLPLERLIPKQIQEVLYPCPYECGCVFLTAHDLNLHLWAFSFKQTVNREPINKQDHLRLWTEMLRDRDRFG